MACMDDRILDETIEELIEMKERNLYLNQHTNKIWQSKDIVGAETNPTISYIFSQWIHAS